MSHLLSGSPARAGGFSAALLQPFGSAQALPRSHPFAGARALPFTPINTPATLPELRETEEQRRLAVYSGQGMIMAQGNLLNEMNREAQGAGGGPVAMQISDGPPMAALAAPVAPAPSVLMAERSQGSSGATLQQNKAAMQMGQSLAKGSIHPLVSGLRRQRPH